MEWKRERQDMFPIRDPDLRAARVRANGARSRHSVGRAEHQHGRGGGGKRGRKHNDGAAYCQLLGIHDVGIRPRSARLVARRPRVLRPRDGAGTTGEQRERSDGQAHPARVSPPRSDRTRELVRACSRSHVPTRAPTRSYVTTGGSPTRLCCPTPWRSARRSSSVSSKTPRVGWRGRRQQIDRASSSQRSETATVGS